MRKTMKSIGVNLLMMFLASSCDSMFEHEFIPHGFSDMKPEIFIQTVMDAGRDSIQIDAGVATPLFGPDPEHADELQLRVKVNGKEISFEEDHEAEQNLPHQKRCYIKTDLKSDDLVEVTAVAPGMEPASSWIILPPELPEIKISEERVLTDRNVMGYYMENMKSECTRFRINLDETPQKDCFYAVQVIRHVEKVQDKKAPEISSKYNNYGPDYNTGIYYDTDQYAELYTLERSEFPMAGRKFDISGTYYGGDLQNYVSSYSVHGKVAFDVYVGYISHEQANGNVHCRPRYQLIVSRISPEFYHAVEKIKLIDGLWSLGIGPHSFAFSNIKNGLGLLGAKTNYVSEWIYTE